MKSRKTLIKDFSKSKKSYTRAPSGEKRLWENQKSSVQSPDYKLSLTNNGMYKFRDNHVVSPKCFQGIKVNNLNLGDSKLSINESQFPIYLKTK